MTTLEEQIRMLHNKTVFCNDRSVVPINALDQQPGHSYEPQTKDVVHRDET